MTRRRRLKHLARSQTPPCSEIAANEPLLEPTPALSLAGILFSFFLCQLLDKHDERAARGWALDLLKGTQQANYFCIATHLHSENT